MTERTAPREYGFISWITRLVREHRGELVGIARREGLTGTDALDAAQAAFITFLRVTHARKLSDDFEESRRLLAVIVRNEARNRRRKHHLSRVHLGDEELAGLAESAPTVEDLILEAEAHVAAFGCIEKLAEVQQRVVTLRLLEGRPGEDVAALLGITPGHVAVLLHRAKLELRACLSEPDDVAEK
ncbi:sigma-70 family RNA polymerase sigma factor [Polyangium sp. y55x31]|uniref:RNA polymerase sigma factor n=1 Tax=Polyangium sp. y55x31 TaxID=3042688 RepID=UPI0024823AF9|nr:sigma-70 family RNA polymerase sigma factor [Polyangium sp. y55x31]MDI1476259.1 sigma-70 family RNA polymerase sigma factor [Polyangium sp. y55x31]